MQWYGQEFCNFVAALEEFAKAVPEADPVFWICSFAVWKALSRSWCSHAALLCVQINQHTVDLGSSLKKMLFEQVCSCNHPWNMQLG